MDETKKHIDELVTTRNQKQAELLLIGRQIASSATPIVVAFADLAESTQIKQDREPEEWLRYIFEFIKRVDQRARDAGGTVVKRIGDELMVTFKDVQASERFVDSLVADTDLQMYRYKIAVDSGSGISLPLHQASSGRSVRPSGRPLCAHREVRWRKHSHLHW